MTATDIGLLVLRVTVGLVFAGHGAQKAFGWWSGPGVAGWRGAMEHMGFRPAGLWAATSIATELGGGLLLAFGLLTPFAAGALVAQAIVIIVKVHLPKGFWNPAGGIEFPLTLGAGAVAILSAGSGSVALDAAFGLTYGSWVRGLILIAALAGALAALAVPRIEAFGRTARQPR